MTICSIMSDAVNKRLDAGQDLKQLGEELCDKVKDPKGKAIRLVKMIKGEQYLIDNAVKLGYDGVGQLKNRKPKPEPKSEAPKEDCSDIDERSDIDEVIVSKGILDCNTCDGKVDNTGIICDSCPNLDSPDNLKPIKEEVPTNFKPYKPNAPTKDDSPDVLIERVNDILDILSKKSPDTWEALMLKCVSDYKASIPIPTTISVYG